MEKEGSMKNFSEKFLKAPYFRNRWHTHYFQTQLTICGYADYFSLIKAKVPDLCCYAD